MSKTKWEPNHSYLRTRVIDQARVYITRNCKVFNKIDLNPSYRSARTCDVLYTLPNETRVVEVKFNMNDYTFEGCTDNVEAEDKVELYGTHLGRTIIDHAVNKMFESSFLGGPNE